MPAIVRHVQQESESWLGPLPRGLSQGGGPAACHPRPNSMKLTLCYHAQHSAGVPNSLWALEVALCNIGGFQVGGGDMIFCGPRLGLWPDPCTGRWQGKEVSGSFCWLSYATYIRVIIAKLLRWMLNLTQYGLCQPWDWHVGTTDSIMAFYWWPNKKCDKIEDKTPDTAWRNEKGKLQYHWWCRIHQAAQMSKFHNSEAVECTWHSQSIFVCFFTSN